MPKIISVGNMKGGVGKTTTAIHIAQYLGRKGKTLLLDADEELQCALFWCSGEFSSWAFDVRPYQEIKSIVTDEFDYIVIDTKGNEKGNDLVSLASASDLLIIPTKPEGLSVAGLLRTLAPLIEAEVKNYYVLLVANEGGRADELREALINEEIPVMTTIIRKSTAVGDAAEKQIPLDAYQNRYAKLVSLDYASAAREVLNHV